MFESVAIFFSSYWLIPGQTRFPEFAGDFLCRRSDLPSADFPAPGCMDTVDIPLNNYTYRFRKLSYREEFAINAAPGEDSRKTILTAALTEVSGLPVVAGDAVQIMAALPDPVIARTWVLYRTGLPDAKFFTTKGLYRAPDPVDFSAREAANEEKREEIIDRTVAHLEHKFGRKELAETLIHEQAMVADARERGTLVRASEKE